MRCFHLRHIESVRLSAGGLKSSEGFGRSFGILGGNYTVRTGSPRMFAKQSLSVCQLFTVIGKASYVLVLRPGNLDPTVRYAGRQHGTVACDGWWNTNRTLGSTFVKPAKMALEPPLYAHHASVEHSDDVLIIPAP